MFEDGYLSPSGVSIYPALSQNVAGVNVADTKSPRVQDLLRKFSERGAQIYSSNSEDALSWSLFNAMGSLPTKDWLKDFFRVAVNERFARRYSPFVEQAQIRFWQPYPAPQIYLQWLGAKVLKEGEGAFQHLENFEARARAKKRLERILSGDPEEVPERPTEVDIEIRLGKELLVFIEAKLFSDASSSGTFSPGRGQILRNMELLDDVARREGVRDRRFILLTLDRQEKVYTQAMRRYRSPDMRRLRNWDEVGNWQALKTDLAHREKEPDSFFQEMTQRLGWILWHECFKIFVHHAVGGMVACRS